MEDLNHALFLWLNAPEHPSTLLLAIATFFAEYVIWALPAIIGIGWLRGSEHTRKVLLEATASGLVGLLINQIIGLIWQHPRPFMIGLGHTLIPHAADSSFPSDHLTLLWAVAFSFLMHRSPRMAGLALALLGLPVAWARIYLGVHFPLDMVGAALVAGLGAWLAFREMRVYLPATYNLALSVHRVLFGKLIQIGWVRK
ncbi:undecaprenyl-diphosphatase [Undibacterium sp. FT79W]|uniref:undecaprenyl-diphosphatase n=1 Tax=Undibacterium sp. FT79W TaxID=2762296 RepID=UPI00164CC531|nr:undecaprenyl-diphosphatase [Undibacterium sp. FT79W]MBC3879532.1 undecaprenyl-diphosphatase [Undibacterium sp. FT79W]